MTLSATEVNQLKQAPAQEKVLPVILHRWSPRSFADRDVSPADLRTVFEAAHWAASSYNEQPWRFLVGARNSETYKKIFSTLMEFNQLWARTAPVLILGAAKAKFSHNSSPNPVALYDLGAAAATLCYQATALGLFTHQMAGFDRDAARKVFNAPQDYVFGAVMALGYQGEPASLTNQQMLAQETAPRQRKDLSEIVWSAWEEPAKLADT
jgi:nitroreductase